MFFTKKSQFLLRFFLKYNIILAVIWIIIGIVVIFLILALAIASYSGSQLQEVYEKYLNEFIGPNYEKFSYKIFSLPGFLFTSIYMFYRKLYWLGLITLIIQLILIIYVNPYLTIAINIITFLFFNSIYVSYAKRKIEKILSQILINIYY